MANLIGGRSPFPGLDNNIVGTGTPDVIFGDPFTTGNGLGVPETGGTLSAGTGGDDVLDGRGNSDRLYGDAWEMSGAGLGGNDRLLGGTGGDILNGDAAFLSRARRMAAPTTLGWHRRRSAQWRCRVRPLRHFTWRRRLAARRLGERQPRRRRTGIERGRSRRRGPPRRRYR